MKRFKDFLDLINALASAWPLLITGLLLVVSIVIGLSSIGAIGIQVYVPLPVIIAIGALALYPVTKFVQWVTRRRSVEPFAYAGLLWKPSRFSFRYPNPLCPHKDCGCQVLFKAEPSVDIEPISGPFLQARNSYRFTYECPIHGALNDVPNLDRAELQMKARLVQTRDAFKSTNNKGAS